MWCSLEPHSQIDPVTWRVVSEHLYPEKRPVLPSLDESSSPLPSESSVSDDWMDWPDEGTSGRTQDGVEKHEETFFRMADCLVACSPDLDVFAFARRNRFVSMSIARRTSRSDGSRTTSKADLASQSLDFDKCRIHVQSEVGGAVTCLVCLPVATNHHSATKLYDWVCLLVGSEFGELRFYSADSGYYLFSQQFAESAVRSIDLHAAANGQALSILHSDGTIALIDCLSLYAALKTARNQIIVRKEPPLKGNLVTMARKDRLDPIAGFARRTPLNLVSDHFGAGHTGGLYSPDLVSQLAAASFLGGYKAQVSPTPPTGIVYSVVGGPRATPFMSFHWATEERSSLGLSDFIGSVSSKVKSVVSDQAPTLAAVGQASASFLGTLMSRKENGPESFLSVPCRQIGIRYVLQDSKRLSLANYPMPGSKSGFMAVCDNTARVCLIEGATGRILRMWKGFREAQCGFVVRAGDIEAPDGEKSKKKLGRSAFLVLFAPRKGVLEIYPALNGPRVGAFNVSKNAKVLQTSKSILGLPDSAGSNASVYFIDSAGTVKYVRIPFLLALQDSSNQSSSDISILKEFRRQLINFDQIPDAEALLGKMISRLKTHPSLKSCVALICAQSALQPRTMDVLLEMCAECCRSIRDSEDFVGDSTDFDRLSHTVELYRSLVNLFVSCMSLEDEGSPSEQAQQLHSVLHLEEGKVQEYLTALNEALMARSSICRAQPTREPPLLTDFLEAFDVWKTKPPSVLVPLAQNQDDERLNRLGEFVFGKIFTSSNYNHAYHKIVPLLPLTFPDICELIFKAWLFRPHSYVAYPPNVHRLFCDLLTSHPEEYRSFDNQAQREIIQARYLPEAMALTMILRAVLRDTEPASPSSGVEKGEFEVVSAGQERWDNLLYTASSILPILTLQYYLCTMGEPPKDDMLVNLDLMIRNQKDPIVLAVAYALSHGGSRVDPSQILALYSKTEADLTDLSSWESCLVRAMLTFPLSLQPDNLFANCALDYALNWASHADDLNCLRCAIAHLRAVSNPVMQHGTAYFLWMSHVKIKFNSLVQLMEKIGKFPKDRLCRKEVGLGDEQVVGFADGVKDVLNILFESNANFELASLSIIETLDPHVDIFIHNFARRTFAGEQGVQQHSMTRMAFNTKCTNYHLVRHHWQLSLVVKMMLEARLRPARPLTLFDKKGRDAMFKPFGTMPLLPRNTPDELDPQVQVSRSKFFRNYVSEMLSGALHYPPLQEAPENEEKIRIIMPDLSDAAALIQEWEMDSDQLWIHCILELYSLGYDYLAERKMCLVQNRPALGSELLILAGQRLAHKLSDPLDPLSKSNAVALLSPKLKTWLKTQDTERLLYKDSTLQSTRTILRYSRGYLPETHAEHAVAVQLSSLLEKFNC